MMRKGLWDAVKERWDGLMSGVEPAWEDAVELSYRVVSYRYCFGEWYGFVMLEAVRWEDAFGVRVVWTKESDGDELVREGIIRGVKKRERPVRDVGRYGKRDIWIDLGYFWGVERVLWWISPLAVRTSGMMERDVVGEWLLNNRVEGIEIEEKEVKFLKDLKALKKHFGAPYEHIPDEAVCVQETLRSALKKERAVVEDAFGRWVRYGLRAYEILARANGVGVIFRVKGTEGLASIPDFKDYTGGDMIM